MDVDNARDLWHRLEPVNAVTYFTPECRDAMARIGLRGFWMGYFASRAAPMGEVTPGVVEATFFNFHPAMVQRAVPDAWSHASPMEVMQARHMAAAASLRRLVGEIESIAAVVLPMLAEAIDGAVAVGRPLFSANRDVAPPDDPVAALWQTATTLREHRGDGHVAVLVEAGLDGCEVHVLFSATEDVSPSLLRDSRGWSTDEWDAAIDRLAGRGFVTSRGAATPEGRTLRDRIERRTDELAWRPYGLLGDDRVRKLLAGLTPAAARISGSGEIIFPNPMGLPRLAF